MQSHLFLSQVFIFAGEVKDVFHSRRGLIFEITLKWTVQLYCLAAEFTVSWQQRQNSGPLFRLLLMQYKARSILKCDTKFGECTEWWAHWQVASAHTWSVKAKENVVELIFFFFFFGVLCALCALSRKKRSCVCVAEELTHHIWGENPELLLKSSEGNNFPTLFLAH